MPPSAPLVVVDGGPLRGPLRRPADARSHRSLRRRRRRRRAYIRSVHFLPSMCTLGNALCGFGAIYVALLNVQTVGLDPVARLFAQHSAVAACYLIGLAMVFDALDGRLARFARHTTEFGAQLDSLADVISFGVAPAILAIAVFRDDGPIDWPIPIGRLMWAVGALYVCCCAIRLARFNVSNEHGEQHHFSFLGLPSPGAAAAVAAYVLVQQDAVARAGFAYRVGYDGSIAHAVAFCLTLLLPLLVGACGLLMVSAYRYPHLVNRYLRGRRSVGTLVLATVLALLLVVAHRHTLAAAAVGYAGWGLVSGLWARRAARAAGDARHA